MKKIFIVVMILLVMLIIIVLFNTLMYRAPQYSVEPAELITFDSLTVIENLSGAIQFKTISYPETTQINYAEFERFRHYIKIRFPIVHQNLDLTLINNHAMLFKWQGSDPVLNPVVLMAHQDVVPIDSITLSEWSNPPFSGNIADEYIWGRGTLDDKCNVIGLLQSVENLLNAGFRPRRTFYFAFGHDEEIGGKKGAASIAAYLEKQNIKPEFVMDEGSVIIKNLIPGIQQPVAMIGIAEKGYLTLQLSTRADGGHSSMPPAQTAIGRLSEAIVKLESNPFPANLEYILDFFEYLGPYLPFDQKFIFANSWIFSPVLENIFSRMPEMNAEIRTTTALTVFKSGIKDNMLPTLAEAKVNFRIIPGETTESVTEHIKNIINDTLINVELYREGYNPSPVSSSESDGYKAIEQSIRQVYRDRDVIVAPYLVVAATDGRYFTSISDDVYRYIHVEFEPADLKRIHGINERISIDCYLNNLKFLTQLIINANEF